jgi:hypothetical protein
MHVVLLDVLEGLDELVLLHLGLEDVRDVHVKFVAFLRDGDEKALVEPVMLVEFEHIYG